MPNRGGYRKYAKKGRDVTRALPLASDSPGLLYGNVTKKFGSAFGVLCSNGKEVRAIIRGKMHKRTWINVNDYVLVDTSDINTFYVVIKYTPDEVRQLKSRGEITFDTKYADESVIFDGEQNNDSDEDERYEELGQNPVVKENPPSPTLTPTPMLVREKPVDDQTAPAETVDLADETSESSDPEITAEIREQRKLEQKKHDEALINKDKLLNKFKNKGRGGKNIVRERGRAAARDKKKRV
ncbi:MAG: translation initiation factor eIF-1A [Hyperionvirus sp.]|uniref:Translation initiation factor eIF-1A n=1 Tax=Hyperionvirus sp. TaxID=2487770 RepID=A0A3G5ADS3_9VIRU|nr:MAG: translation initiation factor eIF-1A [Hyperionvirus sp.]